jgi:hypothetical protein
MILLSMHRSVSLVTRHVQNVALGDFVIAKEGTSLLLSNLQFCEALEIPENIDNCAAGVLRDTVLSSAG